MTKLLPLSKEKLKKYIKDKDDITEVMKNESLFFQLDNKPKEEKTDILVDIEISLRGCETSGFFKD